jgi:flagellar protein FliS
MSFERGSFDNARDRFLRDRVLTATPAQRIVMIYDRLALDLTRAAASDDRVEAGAHLGHALQIVAELQSSLDLGAGGPAANLASLYSFLTTELIAARGGEPERLPGVLDIVGRLREAWAIVADTATAQESRPAPVGSGSWVG